MKVTGLKKITKVSQFFKFSAFHASTAATSPAWHMTHDFLKSSVKKFPQTRCKRLVTEKNGFDIKFVKNANEIDKFSFPVFKLVMEFSNLHSLCFPRVTHAVSSDAQLMRKSFWIFHHGWIVARVRAEMWVVSGHSNWIGSSSNSNFHFDFSQPFSTDDMMWNEKNRFSCQRCRNAVLMTSTMGEILNCVVFKMCKKWNKQKKSNFQLFNFLFACIECERNFHGNVRFPPTAAFVPLNI